MNIYRLAPAVLCAALAGSANAQTVIDNFREGAANVRINSGTGSKEAQQFGSSANIVGGQRDVLLDITNNPYNRSAEFSVDTNYGASFLASGSGVATNVFLDYDGLDNEGNNGHQTASKSGLGLNLSSSDRFEFDFLFADLGLNTNVDVYTYGGGHSRGSFSVGAQTDSLTTYSLATNSFSAVDGGGVDWSKVDRIVVNFDGQQQALDFGLSSVKAVPEPTSMAAMGLGFMGLLARRRKAKKS